MHHQDYTTNRRGGTTALALIAGIGAGVAAGMLLAPRGGKETRQRLKNRIDQVRSKAAIEAGDQIEKVKEAAATLKGKGEDLAKDVKEDAQEQAEAVKQAAARTTQKVAHEARRADASLQSHLK